MSGGLANVLTVGPAPESGETGVAPAGAGLVTVAGDPEGTIHTALLAVALEARAVTSTPGQSETEDTDGLAATQCPVKLATVQIILPTSCWRVTHQKSMLKRR